jgi:uncharacterized protein (DUF934 family)
VLRARRADQTPEFQAAVALRALRALRAPQLRLSGLAVAVVTAERGAVVLAFPLSLTRAMVGRAHLVVAVAVAAVVVVAIIAARPEPVALVALVTPAFIAGRTHPCAI